MGRRSGSVPARFRPAGLVTAVAALLVAVPATLLADSFDDDLARVDEALRKNPAGIPVNFLESCRARRNAAVRLRQMGEDARAERGLRFCIETLKLRLERPALVQSAAPVPTAEEIQARAVREVERALALTPDLAKGRAIYRECAGCHTPEGWGLANGTVPQIAGQHRKVVVKQLADIRAGNRDSFLMLPYASAEAIGGAQGVADVAGYIDTLEISAANGKGSGDDLELGARLYGEHCARCHGPHGEGDDDAYVPRIQAQHYRYLVRQFESIRDGRRRNADAEMTAQIAGFDERELHAVLDYVSRLEPPPELQAPPGWRNPDFPPSPRR